MTRLGGILTAVAILGLSIFNVCQANATAYGEPICTDRPWYCAPEANAIAQMLHHGRPGGAGYKGKSAKLHDLVPQLAAKVGEIIDHCGSQLISGFRPHATIAGTHRASLHSKYPSEAADVAGNPGCIYALLRNWPGGMSTDYGRVKHVHLSYEPHGREWGRRFVHGGHRRYAHHHKKTARG